MTASGAIAAPDEALLGKAEGYPVCPRSVSPRPGCLVGLLSHYDEVFPARIVPHGADVRPLRRAGEEPAIRYTYRGSPATLDEYLSRNRTTGLLVLKGDTILVERYQYDREPTQRLASYSMAKTLVGMLAGIALSEGAIRSLDDPAARYVKALAGTPYGDTPIRHLLTMSSGVRFSEIYSGSDDIMTLARLSIGGESEGGAATVAPFTTRERPAGERFSYSSAETQVLGLVLREATGKTLSDYLAEKIWQPMGAEADASWIVDKGGYENAYAFFNATLRDYGRLGLLLADDGARDGRAIIPAAWVRAATTAPAPQFGPAATGVRLGYGYQTWIVDEQARQFVLLGLRGQAIFVAPAERIVMVHTAVRDVADLDLGEMMQLWRGVVSSLSLH
ncbi:MAG TPA: serine hydrolase [Casimicrobiaceae bacterium]|nr:serine hydrolase [Casimicrobiaceae bacterium]